jgi:hypothetical protein
MHTPSTALHTGKQAYPPTYAQAHAQGRAWLLACDRGEGLGYAAAVHPSLSVVERRVRA